jgi:hypothetical protein
LVTSAWVLPQAVQDGGRGEADVDVVQGPLGDGSEGKVKDLLGVN